MELETCVGPGQAKRRCHTQDVPLSLGGEGATEGFTGTDLHFRKVTLLACVQGSSRGVQMGTVTGTIVMAGGGDLTNARSL